MVKRKCCVLNCNNDQKNAVLYGFPNPDVDPRFQQWVAATGNSELLQLKPENIRRSCRICRDHFKEEHMHTKKLTLIAYPLLNLPEPLVIPQNWQTVNIEYRDTGEIADLESEMELWSISYSTFDDKNGMFRERVTPPSDTNSAEAEREYGQTISWLDLVSEELLKHIHLS